MEDEINIIACVPCLEGIQLGFIPYQNSVIARCEECNCKVWVGPVCLEKKRSDKNIPLWCMKCILKKYGPEAAEHIRALTNKQMGE